LNSGDVLLNESFSSTSPEFLEKAKTENNHILFPKSDDLGFDDDGEEIGLAWQPNPAWKAWEEKNGK
jgi:hypothetical protein